MPLEGYALRSRSFLVARPGNDPGGIDVGEPERDGVHEQNVTHGCSARLRHKWACLDSGTPASQRLPRANVRTG